MSSGEVDYILYGPDREINVPRVSLGEFFLTKLQEYEERVAQVQTLEGVDVNVTYAELLRRSKCVAGLLREHGLKSRDTVMLCCGNNLEFPAILIGTLFVGGALAPVHEEFDANELFYFMGIIGPQVMIASKTTEAKVVEALSQYKQHVTLITIEAVAARWAGDEHAEGFQLTVVDDPDDHVAMVMCSSGTSGKFKSVEMTHFRFLSLNYCERFPESHPDDELVYLNNGDPSWITCHLSTILALGSGHKLLAYPTFRVETFFDAVQRHKVNRLLINPAQLIAIACSQLAARYDLSSLRQVCFSGSPMSQHYVDLAKEKLGCPVVRCYGMTEALGFMKPVYRSDKTTSVGKLGIKMAAKVIDIETGKTLGANCMGELCFRSWSVFKAYRGNPQATKDMFDSDGFLHTGDLAYYDEEEYFYVVGRCNELFKYRCVLVPSIDIEEVLLKHPAVHQVAVVGIRDEDDCAHARACVVLRAGAHATEQELVTLVQEQLPSHKWLYGGVCFMDALPRTRTGKVQKNKLL